MSFRPVRRIATASTLAIAVLHAAPGAAQDSVAIELGDPSRPAGAPFEVRRSPALAPILEACLFDPADPAPARLSQRAFARRCVTPWINGLWLDGTVLLRTNRDIAGQGRGEAIARPSGAPLPVHYPAALGERVAADLQRAVARGEGIALKPLPNPLPRPSLDEGSPYNGPGTLFLPNPYVAPSAAAGAMAGRESFFIVKGLLASADYVLRHPTARIWSDSQQQFLELSTDPAREAYYRRFAERLFRTAKGMVDNQIFAIEFYGGHVPAASRASQLTRSTPPLFTQAVLAVLESARVHGFAYQETLADYLGATRSGFTAPEDWNGWVRTEALPAARTLYAYWTDPGTHPFGGAANPRIATVREGGATQPVYLYVTDGVGPVPELARSTQREDRDVYRKAAEYFEAHPDINAGNRFHNRNRMCFGSQPSGNCGDPVYRLTQDFYAADRARRAAGFGPSGRFGGEGEWAADYAPLDLNVLLLETAEDIDQLSQAIGEPAPTGAEALAARRSFLQRYFARPDGRGYGDRFAGAERPANVPEFAYPYATQVLTLWADVLPQPAARALVDTLRSTFLAPGGRPTFGIPASLTDTGEPWDAPFAWAPIQFLAADGLIESGDAADAVTVMSQWVAAANLVFAATGATFDSYDSTDPPRDPRVAAVREGTTASAWTNAVYLLFVERLYQRL